MGPLVEGAGVAAVPRSEDGGTRRTAHGAVPARLVQVTAWLVLFCVCSGHAQTSVDRVLYRLGFVQVVSPDGASADQGGTVARQVLAAWQFDLSVMQWASVSETPLTVRLISDARLERERPGSQAYAMSQRFTVGISLLGDPAINGTFAHELAHVQAFRVLAGHSVPHYFLEGHGLMLRQLYLDHLGLDASGALANQARLVLSFTPAEARTILTDESRSRKAVHMEPMGWYFVEYLRTREGIPDAVPRMGRVFEMVGRGRPFAQAFEQTFGLSLPRVVLEVILYLKQTEAHPADRLTGTRLDGVLPSQEGRGPRDASASTRGRRRG